MGPMIRTCNVFIAGNYRQRRSPVKLTASASGVKAVALIKHQIRASGGGGGGCAYQGDARDGDGGRGGSGQLTTQTNLRLITGTNYVQGAVGAVGANTNLNVATGVATAGSAAANSTFGGVTATGGIAGLPAQWQSFVSISSNNRTPANATGNPDGDINTGRGGFGGGSAVVSPTRGMTEGDEGALYFEVIS